MAYRQLLVQGVLALLIPTEDLENECLTSLVGQIFSELIIGNLVANKVSEPWLLYEIIIILTRLAQKDRKETASSTHGTRSPGNDREWHSTSNRSKRSRSTSSIHRIFWSFVQWGFLAVSSIRLMVITLMLSRTIPPRPTHLFSVRKTEEATGQYDSEKSQDPSGLAQTQDVPSSVPIVSFNIWSCVRNLLEVEVRMPWLSSAMLMMQWVGIAGPGRIARYDGTIDR
jgi:mitochondrial splicing suppressor protein 51